MFLGKTRSHWWLALLLSDPPDIVSRAVVRQIQGPTTAGSYREIEIGFGVLIGGALAQTPWTYGSGLEPVVTPVGKH